MMNIELKNIHISKPLSQETTAFQASLFIDGIKAGIAFNDGTGGPICYQAGSEKGRQLIGQAEDWARTQPPIVYDEHEGPEERMEIPMDLEHYIDQLLENHLTEKNVRQLRNKMEKDMRSAIVIGVPDKHYRLLKFKRPIQEILQQANGAAQLQRIIQEKVWPVLWEGDRILNTNLPAEIITEKKALPSQRQPRKRGSPGRKGPGH